MVDWKLDGAQILSRMEPMLGQTWDMKTALVQMKDEFETAYDGVFFGGFSKWRKFTQDSFDQLVEHMRNVHRGRSDLKLNQAAIDRASKFTWELSTNVLAEEITKTCI